MTPTRTLLAVFAALQLIGSTARAQDACAPDTTNKKPDPFAFADFTWMNGNPRTKDSPINTEYFTGEFRADVSFIRQFNNPIDHTLVGTSESGRTSELQVQQLGIGGDFHCGDVRGRLMTQLGMYSTMTPRNDPTPGRGQWQLDNAYRYLSEAYGGRHWNKMNGINLDGGIFLSYIGLFSYYNFDNWAYQPSYVSSNTPWFFTGLRAQFFPTERFKVELWLINGWQSYGMFNSAPGVGTQILYRPNGSVSMLTNDYYGHDALGIPSRWRIHTDNSLEVKYYDNPKKTLDKMAFSFTGDLGCERGGGVACTTNDVARNTVTGRDTVVAFKQNFLGYMLYDRMWFSHDLYGLTLGGGAMDNPGRYLVLLPPINGATAFSGTPYFTENPGDPFKGWDASITFDYMPDQFTTFRFELDHREANVPYFSGPGGVTPPGGNTGLPGSIVPGFFPDLRRMENRLNLALLVKL